MDISAIQSDLEKGAYKPLYLLHGEEPFFIDWLSEKIESYVLEPAYRAFDFSIFYGKDAKVEQIREAVCRFPVLAPYHLVIVKEAQVLDKIEDLASYASNPADSTILVLEYRSKKLDARKSLYKAIQSKGVVFESKALYDNQIPQWIVQQVKSRNLNIQIEVANLISEHLGNNLSKIVNELDKLSLNLKSGSLISEEHVQTYIGISKEYNFFQLQKAVGARDIANAMRIGLYFANNEKQYPLVQLTSMLFIFFQKVYKMHAVSQKSDVEIMKALGLPGPFFVKDYKLAASKYSRTKLENIFYELRRADEYSKGFGSIALGGQTMFKELLYKIMH